MSIKKAVTFFGWPLLVIPTILPTLILWLGITCNMAVIARNGGKMPVYNEICLQVGERHDYVHTCGDDSTHLKFLTDKYPFGGTVESVGDILQDEGHAGADVFQKPCYILWGTMLLACVFRKEKFYIE